MNNVLVAPVSNKAEVKEYKNSLIIELIDIETIIHFLSSDQVVHVNREVE